MPSFTKAAALYSSALAPISPTSACCFHAQSLWGYSPGSFCASWRGCRRISSRLGQGLKTEAPNFCHGEGVDVLLFFPFLPICQTFYLFPISPRPFPTPSPVLHLLHSFVWCKGIGISSRGGCRIGLCGGAGGRCCSLIPLCSRNNVWLRTLRDHDYHKCSTLYEMKGMQIYTTRPKSCFPPRRLNPKLAYNHVCKR